MPGFTAEITLYGRGVHYQMVGTSPLYAARVVPQALSLDCKVACWVCGLGLGAVNIFACGYCFSCKTTG